MSDEREPLCCCEYYDKDKNRSHLLTLCCFCEDLDEGFESFITGKGFPQNRKHKFMANLQDRLRIPWKGGAKVIGIDALLPIIILPVIFIIAAQSLWWTIFSFSTITVFLLYIFRVLIQIAPTTKFFFTWTITSIVILYIVFEFVVIPLLEILLEENIALSLLIAAFLFCLYTLRNRANQFHRFQDDSETLTKPGTRFHNCSICHTTVPDKDHHCIWYDCCISRKNQFLFILSLFFAAAALLYSSNLTLTSVCHPFKLYETILLPDDCSEVYQAFELGISFVSAIYSIALAVIILIILMQQIFLVSIGLTRKEWNKLPLSSKCLLGLTSRRPHNRGFIKNWTRIIYWTEPTYSIVSQT
ncbi:palmitoyltransferase ZDHHC23-B [Coccinella septempunctata]|uniref:palmitoyltransferase ZDHHC23-B n=1 Tax=Coccinella septempunctata TaxID=41139 RepID=UPI001D068593|nr:palmitoyltransferase ZDHHC23-B [Coccinella septempunctata]